MSSSAIVRTAQQNIYVTKQQAAAAAPGRRKSDARQLDQLKTREARLVAAKKAEATRLAISKAAAAEAALKARVAPERSAGPAREVAGQGDDEVQKGPDAG